MIDDRRDPTDGRRGGGPGVWIGLGALVLVIVIAFALFSQSRADTHRADAMPSSNARAAN